MMGPKMRCPTLAELPPPPQDRIGWPWTEASPKLPDTRPDGDAWPRVSIVTPSYNQAQFIEETIRSVLLQGYPDLEYVIMDGGSTDGSAAIIRKYEHWLAFWVSEKDKGQADAIRRGFSRTGGAIIAWLNSDDIYVHHAIARAAEGISEMPGVGAVYGDCEYVDADGKPSGMYGVMDFALENHLWRGNPIAQPAVFMRRSAYEAAGGIDPSYSYAMDYDLWLRLGLQAPLHRVPHLIARYRLWENSKTVTSTVASRTEILRALDAFFARPEVPDGLKAQRGCAYAFAWFNLSLGSFLADDVAGSRTQLLRCLAYFLTCCSDLSWLRWLLDCIPLDKVEPYMRNVVRWVQRRQSIPEYHRKVWSQACLDCVWQCYETAPPSTTRSLIHTAVALRPRCAGNVGMWKIYRGTLSSHTS